MAIDLCATNNCVLPSRGKGTVETRLAVSLPPGTYARIAPRSGLAIRNFIDVGVEVLDSDYWGEIKVVLFNHSVEDFPVQAGDRIAQLILERIETPQVKKVAALDDRYHVFNLAHVPMSPRARTSVLDLWSENKGTEKEWF